MYNSSGKRRAERSGSGSKTLLYVLLVVLALAALALVLILVGKNNGGDTRPTGTTPEPGATPGGEAPAALIINEVLRGDSGFVEIFNNSRNSVELESYYLSDNAGKADKWHFPSGTLEAGGYAVVQLRGSGYTGGADGDASLGYPNFNADFKLNSDENGVYLFSRGGGLSDKLVFDAAMPEPVAAVRVGGGVGYTGVITPGAENPSELFYELEWSDMDASDPVRINEVLPSNKFDITDMDGDRSDWVELYNSGSAPVRLLGYYLSDNAMNPAKWALPDVTLEPGQYLVIFLSGKDVSEGNELHASFKLSSADDGLFLSRYTGMRRDGITIPEALSDNVSIGRGEDGGIVYFARPTPGEANSSVGFTDYMGVGGFNPSYCYISEVCAVTAPRSGEMDWLEIHNASASELALTGWHISDSRNDFERFDLSSYTIPAGGYIAISCSSSILDAAQDVAPFSISPSGETLFLCDENGTVIDYFETGALRNGVTSGRENDTENGERVFFTSPTKGARNSDEALVSYAAAPVFSDTSLYHSEPFTLAIKTRSADGEIHYTTDGSAPTEQSPVYTAPIPVNGNTVVRAITCVPGRVSSEASTATYLFETPHSVPVVTLAMNSAEFREVYAVNKPFVPVVERACHIQFYEKDGSLGVESPAGVRVSGASTRAYAQKSLGLYFRAGYGRSSISYPFFGSDYVTNFGGLVLRNAGQDWANARIRDSFTSTAVLDLNIDASAARFVAVYINGEYWGLYDLKENMNEDYLASHFGVDPDTANIIKRNTMELEGSNEDFLRVRSYVVKSDTVIPLTDERYAEFTKWVDAESIADYLIARQYFPDADMFNQKYWRTTDYAVRWRAVFFDSDFAMSSSKGDVLHSYFNVKGVPSANGSLSQMDLYCGLLSNENWRHYFLVRYIYVTKYYLNNDRLLPLFDSMAAEIEPEIDRQIARWGKPASAAHWRSEIAKLREMLVERPQYSKQNLMYVMKLSSSEYARLEAEADALHEANGGVFK